MQLVQSVAETAHALRLGRTSIYALIKQGRLETVKLGSRTLIKTSSILALIGASEVVNEKAGSVGSVSVLKFSPENPDA